MTPSQFDIPRQFDDCMISDQAELLRLGQAIRRQQRAGKPFDRLQSRFSERLECSRARVARRRAGLPAPRYDDALPICQKREQIKRLLADHQVVVLAGETGSGKTTQLPKLCLELGLGSRGLIGHTQPRRLAARAVAARIAEELNSELGALVGYQVRFADRMGPDTYLKLMTDGILLAEIPQDPYLENYEVIIIDEAHERSLNIDFLLGYLKRILPRRPDLKVIITSATIDVERFSRHFDRAPVIEVSGRTYPVEVRYRPLEELLERGGDAESDQQQAILAAVRELERSERERRLAAPGDILVFLSGEREIRETAETLRRAQLRHTEVLPLYARLSQNEQNRIFHPSGGGRRIILATNVAETSLTVPGIRYVIDPGFARISRYSYRSKVQRLPVEPVSQASANQRKGRCGRVAEGVCIRLYSEEDFLSRPEFTDAEIQRTNLAAVILQLLNLGLGNIGDFPFVDPPDSRFVNDGLKLLAELGAITGAQQLTPIGRQLARLPVDPRIGRMVIEAAASGCLREVLVISSALSVQDPRERPLDQQQAADQRHGEYQHEESDFLSLWNLWERYEAQRQALSQNQLRKYCQRHFLSYLRMREWRDVHRQLHLSCRELGLKESGEAADYATIHKALLSGLLGHIGVRQEERDYLGARNRRFMIFPGSGLARKRPKWLVAAELVETSRLFARTVARIEPEWIEPLAAGLVKRSYLEPHWEKKRAQVVAYEQVTLYGMIIVARRKVHYGPVDPETSRQLFIRAALVEGQYRTNAPFFAHNRALLEEVETLEEKSRRRDILVDEEQLYEFYHRRLLENGGERVYNGAGFERWRKQVEATDPELLFLTRAYLMQHGASEVTQEQYPDQLRWEGRRFRLHYQFEPGSAADGVSIDVPVGLLRQLPGERLEWLVPGMIRDKCIALLKGLPKPLRKNFVPVPNYVDAFLQSHAFGEGELLERLTHHLRRMTGVAVEADQWDLQRLEAFHRFNIRVLDDQERLLGQGRDWRELCVRFAEQAQQSLAPAGDHPWERQGLTRWDFETLPESLELEQAGMKLHVYPGVVDREAHVDLCLFDSAEQAARATRAGINRLIQLRLAGQLKDLARSLPRLNESALLYAGIGRKQELLADLLFALVDRTFIGDLPLPRDAATFEQRVEQLRSSLAAQAKVLAEQVYGVLRSAHQIRRRMKGQISLAWTLVYNDIGAQLDGLLFSGFLRRVPACWLDEYPRYLQAIEERLDKFQNNLNRERVWIEELQAFWTRYQQRRNQLEREGGALEELENFRWMLEEYRVSLYAQKLGTRMPVSSKRLRQQWVACGGS